MKFATYIQYIYLQILDTIIYKYHFLKKSVNYSGKSICHRQYLTGKYLHRWKFNMAWTRKRSPGQYMEKNQTGKYPRALYFIFFPNDISKFLRKKCNFGNSCSLYQGWNEFFIHYIKAVYLVKFQGSWALFTISSISLYQGSLYQGSGVPVFPI